MKIIIGKGKNKQVLNYINRNNWMQEEIINGASLKLSQLNDFNVKKIINNKLGINGGSNGVNRETKTRAVNSQKTL